MPMSLSNMVRRFIARPIGARVNQFANGMLHRMGLQLVRSSPELRSLHPMVSRPCWISRQQRGFSRRVRPDFHKLTYTVSSHCLSCMLTSRNSRPRIRWPMYGIWLWGIRMGPESCRKTKAFSCDPSSHDGGTLRAFPDTTRWTPQT